MGPSGKNFCRRPLDDIASRGNLTHETAPPANRSVDFRGRFISPAVLRSAVEGGPCHRSRQQH
jgi:hypothetical protein